MGFEEYDNSEKLRQFYLENGLEVSQNLEREDGAVFSTAYSENGVILAAATLSLRQGIYVLDYIAVSKSVRGKGIGRSAFLIVKQRACVLGADKIYLTARSPKFFESMGFKNGSPDCIDMNEGCKGCQQYGTTCVSVPMVLTLL